MQLTTRSWLLLLATTFPIALMAQAGWWGWVALGWLGLVSALLLADWRLTPDRAAWLVTRRHDDRLSLAANNRIELTVELRRGASPITVWLRDEPPLPFLVEETDRLLTTQVPPRTPTLLTYTVYPPRRGDYRFGDI